MARRAHPYPQVDPGAAGLVDVRAAPARGTASVAEALRIARKLDAGVLGVGAGAWVAREDLARASALGLDDLRAAALARPLPVVEADASEVAVRRVLAAGAPFVIVRDRRGAVGAVRRLARDAPGPSVAARLEQRLPPAQRTLLGVIGGVAIALGARAYLAGGLVRDVLLDGDAGRRDLDIVVEGDGLLVAQALAARLGGVVVEHRRFLTASVESAPWGRLDVATARTERYEGRGTLPHVIPAGIVQDLERRDFTINAMAIELGTAEQRLLDPVGGRADLAQRRLRVLHPLSFVEDPTRVFRAARYAARLGFRMDAWSRQARAQALRLVPYRALSGQRIAAELARIVADRHPGAALRELGAAGALRLLDERYRYTRPTAARIGALPSALGWAAVHGLRLGGLELATLVLLADQSRAVARAALERLALTGEPLGRLARALEGGPGLVASLAAARSPSERVRLLRDPTDAELAWLWLEAGEAAREALSWFVGGGRAVRPALSGDDVLALGVPRGPAVARVLAELRDARLDGRLADAAGEREYVRRWVHRSVNTKEG